jgi:hypothetical protein
MIALEAASRHVTVTLFVLLSVCLAAGCSDRRVRVPLDESGPPLRGGTLEIVGAGDVEHL